MVAHGRVAAVVLALIVQPLEDPLGGVALLGRRPLVRVEDLLEEGLVIRQLRPAYRHRPPVPGRRWARDHRRSGAPVDPHA